MCYVSSGGTVVDNVALLVKLHTKLQHLACLCLHCNAEVSLTLCLYVMTVVMYAVTAFVFYPARLGPNVESRVFKAPAYPLAGMQPPEKKIDYAESPGEWASSEHFCGLSRASRPLFCRFWW